MSMDNPEKQDHLNAEKSEVVLPQPEKSYRDNYHLFVRFLVGLTLLGREELLERLQVFQSEIDTNPRFQSKHEYFVDESGMDTLRYLMIGFLARSNRWTIDAIRSGVNRTYRTTNRLLNTFYTLTDNPLMRPTKHRVEAFIDNLEQEGKRLVKEGRFEEVHGRDLASETVSEIIDEFIDYLAENPKLSELIREQLGEQSIGLAGTMVDNSRRLSVGADNVLEGIIRRLLRLTPRENLPQSPLVGEPQTMYYREIEELDESETGK